MTNRVVYSGVFLFVTGAALAAIHGTVLARHAAAQTTPENSSQLACDLAQSIAIASPGTSIQRSTGVFTHEALREPVRGCRLVITGSFQNSPPGEDAANRLRDGFTANGWQEMPAYSADGKDGTAFAQLADSVSGRRDRQQHGQIVDAVSIRERPAAIEDRAVPGHWEGDLISGSHDTHVATLVEHQSRFMMLVKVESKGTQTVVKNLIKKIGRLPAELRKSLPGTVGWRWPGTESSRWQPTSRFTSAIHRALGSVEHFVPPRRVSHRLPDESRSYASAVFSTGVKEITVLDSGST